ncbi:hypothetical protein [Actinoplanes sp. NPDC051859]|uniref:hypothetical protein n=1 Tax=Actinoplanes sp. NPDC051859 TaxID=3363909 RepID=UPI00378A7566
MFALTERRRTSQAIRLSPGVRIRGPIAYVPRRDHFFALDPAHEAVVRRLSCRIARVVAPSETVSALAELGICDTDPQTPRRAFFGRSVIGRLEALPAITELLVITCFATAWRSIQPVRPADPGVPCGVQTVVSAGNSSVDALLRLRDLLVRLGVTTWALHVIVPVGKAAGARQAALLAPGGRAGTCSTRWSGGPTPRASRSTSGWPARTWRPTRPADQSEGAILPWRTSPRAASGRSSPARPAQRGPAALPGARGSGRAREPLPQLHARRLCARRPASTPGWEQCRTRSR